jgi:hypothetical protein
MEMTTQHTGPDVGAETTKLRDLPKIARKHPRLLRHKQDIEYLKNFQTGIE